MSFKWENVNIEVKNTNRNIKDAYIDIIKNCSGQVNHGEIYAIMGPSGGGKTTLLNALAGRIPTNSNTQGEITFNNKTRKKEEWLKMVGFVNQDDCVYEELSITDTLKYAANFRLKNNLGGKYTGTEIDIIVEQIIKDLKLENVSKNEVRKISGGERKRLSLGIELITDPPIIFLDEPTSGLDTLTALKICKILKKLAIEKNKIVILTIHSPSQEVFNLFDYLLLLSKGNAIYNGRISDVENFFTEKQMLKRPQITYPEFIVELCSDDFKNENPHLFYCEESIFKEDYVIKEKRIRRTKNDYYINVIPNIQHIQLLLRRRFTIETHRKMNFLKTQCAKFIIYIFLVVFSYQSCKLINKNFKQFTGVDESMMSLLDGNEEFRQLKNTFCTGLITTTTLFFVIFTQVTSTITSFFDEANLVKREIAVESYSTASYFISLILYQLIIETFVPCIACILMHKYIPIANIYIFSSLLLSGLFTVPFGLCIGSISTSKQMVIILSSIFGTVSSIPPSTITDLIIRYGSQSDGTRNIVSYMSYLFTLISPLYWSSYVTHQCYNLGIESIDEGGAFNMLRNIIIDLMNKPIMYVNGHQFDILFLLFLMVVSPFVCILIGTFLLGFNLMPDIRMKLEKDYKNKSK